MIIRRATIIRGPNGCGKTSDLEALVAGDVSRLKYIPPSRHSHIYGPGFARQGRAVPFLAPTVLGTIVSSLLLRGSSLADACKNADVLLNVTGMSYLRDRSFRYLSGGEAQIINVLSAIVSAMDCLLLDDPFCMLDQVHQDALANVLNRIEDYIPLGNMEGCDVLMTLTRLPTGTGQVSWIQARDRMEIVIKPSKREELAMSKIVEMGKVLLCHRRGRTDIELNRFTVRVSPNRKPLFAPLSCTFRQGNLYELRAPNGVGKSLMLAAMLGHAANNGAHMLGRLMTFQVYPRLIREGSIDTIGDDIDPESILFVPQHSELLTADRGPKEEILSVKEDLPKQIMEVIEEILTGIGVDDRRIGEYSFGEARFLSAMIGLLCALGNDSVQWVFLDEIDSRLDELRRSVLEQLIQLFLSGGGGVIMATHSERSAKGSLPIFLSRNTV
jgi:ABC-type Mn2+/Zn2+ transport system ATPase subunit